jgi:sorbitol-6-phosphate 2-dehydrogenase
MVVGGLRGLESMALRSVEKGRVGLVTGAASGLGFGVVRRLLRDGWAVVAVDLPERVAVTEGAASSARDGSEGRVTWCSADVGNEDDVKLAVKTAVDSFGRLDLTVANAGGGGVEVDVVDCPTDEFDEIVRVNLRGAFLTCREAARVMRSARRGSIIATSSMFGQDPAPRGGAYNASKAGVIALVQTMAIELAPFGIRVNAIAPGYMTTDGLRRAQRQRASYAGISLEEEIARVDRLIPLGRHGTAEDFADAVAFLASEEASYITGHTLGITGGVVRR